MAQDEVERPPGADGPVPCRPWRGVWPLESRYADVYCAGASTYQFNMAGLRARRMDMGRVFTIYGNIPRL